MLRLLSLTALTAVSAVELVANKDTGVITAYLFDAPSSEHEKEKLNGAFEKVWKNLEQSFDEDQHSSFLSTFDKNLQTFAGFANAANGASCASAAPNALALKAGAGAIAAFPGGITQRVGGFDLSKLVMSLAEHAGGAAAAQGGIAGVLAMNGLQMGASMVQNLVANAIHIIPPMIPAPVWNNQPLFCMPMVTGHNCFGAVFHTITTADFVQADTTDSQLDGYIASFPATFADKVGPAPHSVYENCFRAAMSMKCASIFPKCTGAQSGNDPTTKGTPRTPMCFSHCISTLVACPGFWVDDVAADCEDVSAPPACSTAFFWRTDKLPPQYASFEASAGGAGACPTSNVDIALSGAAADAAAEAGAAAGEAAAGSVRLP